jgi:hypothetical protein
MLIVTPAHMSTRIDVLWMFPFWHEYFFLLTHNLSFPCAPAARSWRPKSIEVSCSSPSGHCSSRFYSTSESARLTNMELAFYPEPCAWFDCKEQPHARLHPEFRLHLVCLFRVNFLFQRTVPVGLACNRKRVTELTTNSNLWKYEIFSYLLTFDEMKRSLASKKVKCRPCKNF